MSKTCENCCPNIAVSCVLNGHDCRPDLLLPAGSEEHEVLQTRSIHVATSCQFHYNSTFKCVDIKIIWVVKNKKHLRDSAWATILPLAIILTSALWVLDSMIA